MMVLRHEVGHSTIPQNYIYKLTEATFLLRDSLRHALKAKFYSKKCRVPIQILVGSIIIKGVR